MGGRGSGRRPSPCGTTAAYQRHHANGETPCAACLKAHADYRRNNYKPRPPRMPKVRKGVANRDYVRAEKLKRGSCMDCGLIIDERTVVCIDFDHRDQADKRFTISYEIDKVSIPDLAVELAKCDAVCRNCHALRTHDAKAWLYRRTDSAAMVPSLFD